MINHLKGWERQYGGVKVYPAKQTKPGLGGQIQWNDIFVKRVDGDPTNVSDAAGVNCGHPSLSPRGNEVVFIKATKPVGR